MKRNGLVLMILFILPVVILIPQRGKALYFFAAKEGTRCGTCHLNPTGGMLRNQVGLDYAQNDHSFKESGEETQDKLNFSLGENLQIGSDMRFLYTYKDTAEITGYRSRSSFFTMQGRFTYLPIQVKIWYYFTTTTSVLAGWPRIWSCGGCCAICPITVTSRSEDFECLTASA